MKYSLRAYKYFSNDLVNEGSIVMHEGNILQFGTINDLLHDKKFKWPIKPNHNHSILTLKFVAHGTLELQPIYCPAGILENIAHPFRYGMLQNIFHHVLHDDITDRTAMTAGGRKSDARLIKHTTYSVSQEICTRFCCALLCCGYAIVHNEFT